MYDLMKIIFTLAICCIMLCVSGCYWDKSSELYPVAQCDTSSLKWSTTIQPIMQQQCAYAGCHSAASARGGINLSTYAGVRDIAQDGSLVGSIEHSGAYTPMPYQTTKLPDCQIAQIRGWVAAGALNN